MKKIYLHRALGILLFLLVGRTNYYAQEYWKIVGSMQVPAIFADHYIDNNSHSSKDIIDSGVLVFDLSNASSDIIFEKKNDTIKFSSTQTRNGFYATEYQIVHTSFIIDTTEKKIRDFSIGCSFDTAFPYQAPRVIVHHEIMIKYSSINCQVFSDSIIKIFQTAYPCVKSIDSIYSLYYYWFTDNIREPGIVDTSRTISINYSDTSSFMFSLYLAKWTPPNFVARDYEMQKINCTYSLFDHIINFAFSSSGQKRKLSIYDILGREIKQIEIPAGSSSYTLSSAAYPKGTYFARLGLQSASFIVN